MYSAQTILINTFLYFDLEIQGDSNEVRSTEECLGDSPVLYENNGNNSSAGTEDMNINQETAATSSRHKNGTSDNASEHQQNKTNDVRKKLG